MLTRLAEKICLHDGEISATVLKTEKFASLSATCCTLSDHMQILQRTKADFLQINGIFSAIKWQLRTIFFQLGCPPDICGSLLLLSHFPPTTSKETETTAKS